jgi:hypothetical protein
LLYSSPTSRDSVSDFRETYRKWHPRSRPGRGILDPVRHQSETGS